MFREGHIYIQPRRSGKTTSLLEMMGDGDILITVVKNFPMPMRKGYINIVTPREFTHMTDGLINSRLNKPYNLLIDEWFHYSDNVKKDIHNIINTHLFGDIIIKSTSDKLYNRTVIDMLRMLKSIKDPSLSFTDIEDEYIKNFKDEYNSILSDPRFTIHEWCDFYKKELSKLNYNIEILGEVFQND